MLSAVRNSQFGIRVPIDARPWLPVRQPAESHLHPVLLHQRQWVEQACECQLGRRVLRDQLRMGQAFRFRQHRLPLVVEVLNQQAELRAIRVGSVLIPAVSQGLHRVPNPPSADHRTQGGWAGTQRKPESAIWRRLDENRDGRRLSHPLSDRHSALRVPLNTRRPVRQGSPRRSGIPSTVSGKALAERIAQGREKPLGISLRIQDRKHLRQHAGLLGCPILPLLGICGEVVQLVRTARQPHRGTGWAPRHVRHTNRRDARSSG